MELELVDYDDKSINLLLVDDDYFFLDTFEKFFAATDINVFSISNVNEAIEELKRNHFDVLIADIHMPTRSGLELIEYVNEKFPSILKIVISGSIDKQHFLEMVNQLKVDHVFEKPVNMPLVEKVILEKLSNKHLSGHSWL